MKKTFVVWTMMTSAMLCLAACGGGEQKPNADAASAATSASAVAVSSANPDYPTYLVGSEISYEPFEFKDAKSNPTGFEVELLTAIGQAAKFNVQFVHTPRGQMLETLNNDNFTIWASALSVTPERQAVVDFSEPYIDFVREIYVLDKPENANLKTAEDFKGKRIAVNVGSKSAIEEAERLSGSPETVVKAKSFYLSLTELHKGEADGVLGDSRVLQYYQAKHPEVKTRAIELNDPRKNIAFAVKKGNQDVLAKINQGLAAIKADGTYDKLLEKYFGKIK